MESRKSDVASESQNSTATGANDTGQLLLTTNLIAFMEDQSRDSLYIIVPMTLCYAMIFVSGIIGNVSTCVVIFYNKYMHTATNFYLFSLAMSDLLLLLSALPKEMYELWFRYSYVFGEVTCIVQGFTSESAANATVLTITAFTIERYVAICHPFMSQKVSKLSRATKHIVIIWLMALCLAVPQAVQFGVVRSPSDQSIECTVIPSVMDHAFVISSLVFFVIPVCVISVLYVLIGLRLRNSQIMKKTFAGNFSTIDRQVTKYQSRVIRMLVAVVVAFIICWAPFHAQRLLAMYGQSDTNSETIMKIYNVLTYTSGILYYLSATINPILYNIMSSRFRRAFMLTFSTLCGCCVSESKRGRYLVRSRFYNASRTTNFYAANSTPRSSISQKSESTWFNGSRTKCQDQITAKTNGAKMSSTRKTTNPTSVAIDRPISTRPIKAKLIDDLYDAKFAQIQLLSPNEPLDLL